ncbi:MAG: UDP-3-O-(3-hydroxymyristoyl)glucosamine N-acyltransferase [Acidobacteria bacterium]|nr:UDP-3-O-(3-hydroxymyristoyl)glucosamine N-acyltransferase [Acidobacteriota bacterium]
MKLRDLAARCDCRLEGDGNLDITGVAGIEEAGPGDVTFVANPRYLSALHTTRAGAVIVSEEAPGAACAMLRTSQPYLAFAKAVALFADIRRPPAGVDPLASVAADVELGGDVSIAPFVSIGAGARIGARTILCSHVSIGEGASIGADCILHPHASVRERCVLGARVIVQNGAVIGSDGFGFVPLEDGTHHKIPQTARVVIEDDVEIGANTTIDRPAVGETRIAAGTKIDNLVQIAHGVKIGRNVMLAAQVGVAGSTTLEDDVVLAGQVGVAGHLTIGKGTRATAQTGIPNSVAAGSFVSGYPAVANREWLKASALIRKLPELKKRIAELERRIASLEAQLAVTAPDRTRSRE